MCEQSLLLTGFFLSAATVGTDAAEGETEQSERGWFGNLVWIILRNDDDVKALLVNEGGCAGFAGRSQCVV